MKIKVILCLLIGVSILCSESFAQAVAIPPKTTGVKQTETSAEKSSTNDNSTFCDPKIKQKIAERNKQLVIADTQEINKIIKKQPSVSPTKKEKESGCFSVPDFSLIGLGGALGAGLKFSSDEIMSGIAGMMGDGLDIVGGMMKDIGEIAGNLANPGKLMDSLLGAGASFFNEACTKFVDATTDATKSYLNVETYTKKYKKIPYVGKIKADNSATYKFSFQKENYKSIAADVLAK
ncbi:MAG: hypothetical protein N4A43_00220 [Alphaproteobacteria bacterium]|jgi:hypothetical protein|nr:hypothetical protein [Alphaproteobacteria bacterium]